MRILTFACFIAANIPALSAQEVAAEQLIDLSTVLRLAGAQSIEVEIAEARVRESKAAYDSATLALYPTLSLGVGYRKHSGQLQDIVGQVSDITKESFTGGATLSLSLELGEAIYRRLAAKQTALATKHQLESQRRLSVLQATLSYYDLTSSEQSIHLLQDAMRTAQEYRNQIAQGVKSGIAFKGDELRAASQVNRLELRLQQAKDQQRNHAARLAHVLRLNITTPLASKEHRPTPVKLFVTERTLDAYVRAALNKRPEMNAAEAQQQSAAQQAFGAIYAPYYPTLGAQVFGGGLGGSESSARNNFNRSTDTVFTLSWKIGAGGLGDEARKEGARARLQQTELAEIKARDEITRQVVEAHTSFLHLSKQILIAQEAIKNSQSAYDLSLQRKDFAIGTVLETLQSQQELIQAHVDYVQVIGEFNKAQYRLKFSTGE